MPAPLSQDLRLRAVTAWENGEGTQQEIATRFAVGEASLRRWVARKRATGGLAPKVADRSHTRRLDAAAEDQLRALVARYPDASEDELTEHLEAAKLHVSRSTVHRCLRRLGLSRKKRPL